MIFFQITRGYYLFILSGIAGGVSLISGPWGWFLSLIFLIPVLGRLYDSSLRLEQIFRRGFVFGFFYIGTFCLWIFETYPLSWMGITSKLANFFFLSTSWIFVSSLLGVFLAGWFVVFSLIKKDNWLDPFVGASLWVLFEFLRAFFFGLVFWGDGALAGPHFTLGFLGYALSWAPLFLPLASIGGVYLLSFFGVLINFIFYRDFIYGRGLTIILSVFLGSVFLAYNFIFSADSVNNLKVAFSSSFLPHNPALAINRSMSVIRALRGKDPDVIVFPENSVILREAENNEDVRNFLRHELGSGRDVLLVSSGRVKDRDTYKNRLFFYRSNSDTFSYYDKRLLVVQGEFTPAIFKPIFHLFGREDLLSDFESSSSMVPGARASVEDFNGSKIGSLLCSEFLSPVFFKELVGKFDANILLGLSSQVVFHDSRIINNFSLSLAKTRAAENNRYVVLATNYNDSALIDNKGKIVDRVSPKSGEVHIVEVPLIDRKSLYTKTGDGVLWLSLFVIITAIGWRFRKSISDLFYERNK